MFCIMTLKNEKCEILQLPPGAFIILNNDITLLTAITLRILPT